LLARNADKIDHGMIQGMPIPMGGLVLVAPPKDSVREGLRVKSFSIGRMGGRTFPEPRRVV